MLDTALHGVEQEGAAPLPFLEEIGMVADFAELHHQVHQVFHLLFAFSHHQILCRNLTSDLLIQRPLSIRHIAENFLFSFRCDFLLDISLQPSEHKRLQNCMQSFQLMLVEGTLVHRASLNVFREPFLELLMVIEELRHDEMEEGPQLSHGVLDGRSCEEESVSGLELQETFPPATHIVFDRLGFVQNHVVPFDPHEFGLVFGIVTDQVITCDQYVNLQMRVAQILGVQILPKALAFIRSAEVWEHSECRAEFFKFILPVIER